jgi:hypothetical protein
MNEIGASWFCRMKPERPQALEREA